MKKLLMAAAIVCVAAVSHAAAVTWTATASSAYNGQTMYLLTAIASQYESLEAFTSSAVDSAVVSKVGPSYKVSQRTAESDKITASSSFYLAVVDSTDGMKIHYVDVTTSMKDYVYTPPDSAFGTFSTTFASVATSTMTATVAPEPTSGLLMLLGIAGLALKRKRA